MKKIAWIILTVSLLSVFAGLYINGIFSVLLPDAGLGIIGGADRPTVNWYWRQMLNRPHGLLVHLGAVGAVISCLTLIFSRTVKKNCALPTSGTALGLSACASLGAFSLLLFASCFFLTHPSKHPIALPAGVCVGLLALIGFILLMALYFRLRAVKPSRIGVFYDVTFSLLCMPAFFRSYQILYNLVSL
ncbi:MAG: hypothetical protein IJD59_03300 [Clostridia bacterium]|nr:hypothetical protein [Clostridia bacterium]